MLGKALGNIRIISQYAVSRPRTTSRCRPFPYPACNQICWHYSLSCCLKARNVTLVSTESCLEEVYLVRNARYFEYSLSRHVQTNNCKEWTYLDSGNYALSAADRVTDNGAIQTGKAHPHRHSISHPYAPVPAPSKVTSARMPLKIYIG